MGLDTTICAVAPAEFKKPAVGYTQPAADYKAKSWQREKLIEVPFTDGPNQLFALALGAIVQQVNNAWFAQNYTSEAQQRIYREGRPNCLRASDGYKSRPLNGIWSTAPFLHNGAVPTVYDMLRPPDERPRYVQLGSKKFDAVNLGIVQDDSLAEKIERNPRQRYLDGYFVLDTQLAGNLNTGHEFSSRWNDQNEWYDQERGVIGPELSHSERMALIEFLKTQ